METTVKHGQTDRDIVKERERVGEEETDRQTQAKIKREMVAGNEGGRRIKEVEGEIDERLSKLVREGKGKGKGKEKKNEKKKVKEEIDNIQERYNIIQLNTS